MAYKSVAAASQRQVEVETLHRKGYCEQVSDSMTKELKGKGYQALTINTFRPYHCMVAIIPDSLEQLGKPVLADGTWQQFLDDRLSEPKVPKVLVGINDDIAEQARYYGLDEAAVRIYLEL